MQPLVKEYTDFHFMCYEQVYLTTKAKAVLLHTTKAWEGEEV
jgi:hypothetical protein